jgi:preprotein translocase subunit SecF
MFEVLGKTSIDFMRWRRYSFALSAVFVILGAIALVQIARGVANLGIDFAGGIAIQLKFDRPVPIEEVRTALVHHGWSDVELQDFMTENKLLIRIKVMFNVEEKTVERVLNAIERAFPDNPYVVESSMEIGPTIGHKLQQDAVLAITLSMVGIVLYIASRFELRFGIAAAIATLHDVLAVLGLFYLMDKEVTLLLVTALLTLAGYSLTDTVVVFDRIREHLKVRRRETFESVINSAINQVLSRTVVVSLTVILVLIPLTFGGGEVLHDFSLALLVGVIIGTYSSVFVASPLLALWKTPTNLASR